MSTSSRVSDQVPDTTSVIHVLRQLEPLDVARAAAHLLSPLTVMVGAGITVAEGKVTFRGRVAHTGGLDWAGQVEAVGELMRSTRVDGDTYLRLADEPVSWLKYVRTGAETHLAGARELFDHIPVLFTLDVPLEVARGVAQMVVQDATLESGTLLVRGRSARVDVGTAYVRVSAHFPFDDPQ